MAVTPPFQIGETTIAPGTRKTVDLPVSVLSDHTPVTMSVHVVHGRRPGPTLFLSGAIHGDEIIGVEIIRRVLRTRLAGLRGTLLAVPIVNTFGFLNHSRYLPDRRDLNRSFPGSEGGSLAGRLAHLFLEEIVKRSDFGIDFHSAAIHRTNLPQIRVCPSNDETMTMAHAFNAPVILRSGLREGSLRLAAQKAGVDVLLFEAGEGLRFDEFAARAGVSGTLQVMQHLGMLPKRKSKKPRPTSIEARSSTWTRAPAGGLLRTFKTTGDQVTRGEVLGIVSDPFGEVEVEVRADNSGLIVGRANLPVVNEGDALFHIARLSKGTDAEAMVDQHSDDLDADPLFDEDEII